MLGSAYCEKHQHCEELDKKRRWKESDKTRGNSTARGYGSLWRKIRKQKIYLNPMCEHCGAIGEEVDHITPLKNGGTNDMDNLQILCRSCHRKKTERDKREYRG